MCVLWDLNEIKNSYGPNITMLWPALLFFILEVSSLLLDPEAVCTKMFLLFMFDFCMEFFKQHVSQTTTYLYFLNLSLAIRQFFFFTFCGI